MKEKTISKFKLEKNTYKLLKITDHPGWAQTEYLIVKNRKQLRWSEWEETAKKEFASIIINELLQQKFTF